MSSLGVWADKYRPTSLQKLDFHLTQAQHLKNLIQQGDFPHLLFYGPYGAGKKTRIMALLKELYGPGVERLRHEKFPVLTPSNKKLEVTIVSSNYHIEVNPSDVGIYDRLVVMELIKNVAQTHQFDSTSQREFKVIVLTEVDHLSKDAQHALRRTMEKYIATCRLILLANSVSNVIPAIKSRCLGIRVPAPSMPQIVAVLQNVCKKEGLTIPTELAEQIAERSKGNLRHAILMLETTKIQQYPFKPDQEVMEKDYVLFIRGTAKLILAEQTTRSLLAVRERLEQLLFQGISVDIIWKGLSKELVKNCDVHLKNRIIESIAHHEHRLRQGVKHIYHLEAFIALFMMDYLTFIEESVGEMF